MIDDEENFLATYFATSFVRSTWHRQRNRLPLLGVLSVDGDRLNKAFVLIASPWASYGSTCRHVPWDVVVERGSLFHAARDCSLELLSHLQDTAHD